MTRIYIGVAVAVTVASVVATCIVYPWLPAEIPIHWNIRGEIDDHGSKEWAAFLAPGFMVGLLVLLALIPWMSPRHFTVDTFQTTYWFIATVIMTTFAYIQVLILWAGLRGPVDTTRPLLTGLLIMFALIGSAMGNVRQNFWVGVRTPWTLASERVWNDTHWLAARMFVVASVLGLGLLILPLPLPAVSVAVFVLIMAAALVPVIYSLVRYKRLERRGEIP
ncbi:MAG: SdpI family protein [Pirellulaceae bacterium]